MLYVITIQSRLMTTAQDVKTAQYSKSNPQNQCSTRRSREERTYVISARTCSGIKGHSRGQQTMASIPYLRSGLRSRDRKIFPKEVGSRSFAVTGCQCAQRSNWSSV